jgi:two-component system cell cycle sensor histidine kinase PleC
MYRDEVGLDNVPHEWTAGALASPMPPLRGTVTCSEAYNWFAMNPDQPAAAILDPQDRVVGIVNRLRFLARYAQRYVPELYGKESILALANPKPMVVDENLLVLELGQALAQEWPDALRECFVVTSAGRYLGIGTSEALVRSKVAILTSRENAMKSALLSATDANETKSHFLALMSHELRTPLNAIIGFSEVLKGEMFGPLGGARYLEYAADIHDAGRHLLALINDILDVSKAEAGKLELCLEEVDVAALFADCTRLTAGRVKDKRLHCDVRVPDPFPALQADALRLKQMMLNLITNAIKFTPEGGHLTISAGLSRDGGMILSVQDDGIGMAPEMIPIALEPFRQIASPFSRNIEGTGLGLSLVKLLTEQHGGNLEIKSAPGVGTTVSLMFPSNLIGLRARLAG